MKAFVNNYYFTTPGSSDMSDQIVGIPTTHTTKEEAEAAGKAHDNYTSHNGSIIPAGYVTTEIDI